MTVNDDNPLPFDERPPLDPEFARTAAAEYFYDLVKIAFAVMCAKFRNALRRLGRG